MSEQGRIQGTFFGVLVAGMVLLSGVANADEPFRIRCEVKISSGGQELREILRLENSLGIWKLPMGRFFQVYRDNRVLRSPPFRAYVIQRGNDLSIQVADANRRYLFKSVYDEEPVIEVYEAQGTENKLGSAKCTRP